MEFLEYVINNNFIFNNTKFFPHPYIEQYYDKEFSNIKDKKIKLLEIGVRSGISLKMWHNWFTKGQIYGLDIINQFNISNENVFFNQIDAYTQPALDLYEDDMFDFIIDDGPHTPVSQQFTIQKWINKLKPGGKIIIEDIGCKDDNNNTLSPDASLDFLLKSIDTNISTYKIFDLRNSGQYDSIILEIAKK
jgi:hypothetical protein